MPKWIALLIAFLITVGITVKGYILIVQPEEVNAILTAMVYVQTAGMAVVLWWFVKTIFFSKPHSQ